MASTSTNVNDISRPETPVASQHVPATQIPTIQTPEFGLAAEQQDPPSLASTLKLPNASQFLSPTPSTATQAKQKQTFTQSELQEALESLGPDSEMAAADMNVAGDGSFIETSSGPAAREIKRRYDQLAGVGPSLRSPYAITAFVNQHGKSMYRLTRRDEHSAPAANAAEVEKRITKTSTEPSHSPHTKRRSRLSMHFLQPVFSKSNSASPPQQTRPPTVGSSAPRKLHRKTRSIPDMASAAHEDESKALAPTFTVTGRGHSQSVTAADSTRPTVVFHSPPPQHQPDPFGHLMGWSPASKAKTNQETDRSRPTGAALPFGPGIMFTPPSKKGTLDRLRPPQRTLREMQSFESGLTARQDDPSPDSSPSPEPHRKLSRPPSAIRLSQLSTNTDSSDSHEVPPPPEPAEQTISAESMRLITHFSTDVFNVLQTYRGLPVFESLVPGVDEGTTVIKLSLTNETSAAPRDDPRFVIWGEALIDQDADAHSSSSRDSLTDQSSPSMSRRRSSKASRMKSPGSSSSRTSLVEGGQRILLAATIERWLAQLTSDLNYDELLNFFLTYRTYVSAVDLCHLLICRFHWALQKPTSREDETVRRIVRVRTFVALRYWMLTFFTVDFIPNRDLRLLISYWLNTLSHDPLLQQHMDGIGIVRRLIKVAKDCKKAHIRATDKPRPTSPVRNSDPAVDHLLGKSFAKATRKAEDDDDDLDLDFLPDEAKADETSTGFPSDPANAHLTVGHAAGGAVLSQSRPGSALPLASFNILQRTDHAPGPNSDDEPIDLPDSPSDRHSTLSRAFTRTIGRLGRWRRVVMNPRMSAVPPKTAVPLAVCGVGVSAFDLEIVAAGDLLTSSRGVEEYLKLVEPPSAKSFPGASVQASPVPPVPPLFTNQASATSLSVARLPVAVPSSGTATSSLPHQLPSPESPLGTQSVLPIAAGETVIAPLTAADARLPSPPLSPDAVETVNVGPPGLEVPLGLEAPEAKQQLQEETSAVRQTQQPSFIEEVDSLGRPDRAQSFRSSSSTDSFGEPLTTDDGPLPRTFPGSNAPWQFDVVSIDELDFSDTSSIAGDQDPVLPPGLTGLQKSSRKLPNRRDFEFVRRSEVSSMGIISHESMRDSINSSTHSEASPTSSNGGPQPISRWQMKSLQQTFEDMSNHGGDSGDVEAALRRLEGQINPELMHENAQKVDGWVKTLQERMLNGDYDYASSIFSEDEIEGFIDEMDEGPAEVDGDSNDETKLQVVVPPTNDDLAPSYEESEELEAVHTPMPTQTAHQLPTPPGLDPPQPSKDVTPLDEVVPLEILQSRMSASGIPPPSSLPAVALSTKFTNPEPLKIHESLMMQFHPLLLAQHFSMIDRELFMSIKFEELVTGEWTEYEEEEVLDWAQYLRDRARWKVESRLAHKTTALAAVRVRFNLMVSFVISEIVLSPPSTRGPLVNQFIHIAVWCFQLNNFHTLMAILAALRSEYVVRALRDNHRWHPVGTGETKVRQRLEMFAQPTDDFRVMRETVDAIIDNKPKKSSVHAPSIVSHSSTDSQSGKAKAGADIPPPTISACVPFIGMYLSQLARLNKLPALIDPTDPNSPMGIDPETAVFDPPAHPELFSSLQPLPPSMQLEPLINVHKQRRIADVIKSLVAGQHLASRVQFNIDKKLFQKCLRLRGLDAAYLNRALAMYE